MTTPEFISTNLFCTITDQLMPAHVDFTLANNAYQEMFRHKVTGQTVSTLAPFGRVYGSQTYGSVQGPAYWDGYNPDLLSAKLSSSVHGAMGMSVFGSAGDTDNGSGGYGLEFNTGCFRTPDGTKGTNSIEVVAVDDNTNTVNSYMRCGQNSSAGRTSNISFQIADGTPLFGIGPAYRNLSTGATTPQTSTALFYTDVTVSPITGTVAGGGTSLNATGPNLALTNAGDGSVATPTVLSINCNTNASSSAQLQFRTGGVTKWNLEIAGSASASPMYLFNTAGNVHEYRTSGANTAGNYQNASTYFFCLTKHYSSVVVNNADSVMANAAVNGFLYIPAVAGAPSGTPTAYTGGIPICFDNVNNKIYAYNSGWKAIGVV